jgi:SAM-dependent methyltransferase
MGLLGRLRWGRRARLVDAVLASAGLARDLVAVVGSPALAELLAQAGRRVAAVGRAERPLRRARHAAVRARADLAGLPFADGALAALVAAPGDAAGALAELARAVRAGGLVVVLDTVPRDEASRRALCAGLVDLEQRAAGRAVVTSGRVPNF